MAGCLVGVVDCEAQVADQPFQLEEIPGERSSTASISFRTTFNEPVRSLCGMDSRTGSTAFVPRM